MEGKGIKRSLSRDRSMDWEGKNGKREMKRWKIKAKKMEGNTFRERRERLREGKDSEKEKGKGRMNKIGKGKRDQKEKRERKRKERRLSFCTGHTRLDI